MECIPSIDLRRGQVVRLQQGDFARAAGYAVTPRALAERYAAAGARRLHVVDLDGATGEGANLDVIRELCMVPGLEVQAGGGLRDEAGLTRFFDAGVAAAVVGSLAVKDPERVRGWLALHGGARIVLALDVRASTDDRWDVLTDAWRQQGGVTLWELLEQYRDTGLGKVLCTDVNRDGLLQGPNLDLYRECLRQHPNLGWQASGGVSNAGDLEALCAAGVPAVVVGRALLEGGVTHELLRTYRGAT